MNRRTKGSSKSSRPRSRIAFVKKRAYSRCMTACSTPPVYWSTGAHVATASRSKIASSDLGLANRNWYHDESTNVSIVSVSRLAGLPQRGQGVFTKPSCSASGDSPVGRNSESSGSSTGSSSSGTGTVPHSPQ